MLDALAEELRTEDLTESERASLALTLARAGRPEDRLVLDTLAEVAGPTTKSVLAMALALGQLRPPASLERADSGYRFETPGGALYVEDPVAAHFHAAGRWGPPLRPDPDRTKVATEEDLSAAVGHALAGGVVIVPVRPPNAALRVMRAGITTDASLRAIVRWPAVKGLGVAEGRRPEAAYELHPGVPEPVGSSPTMSATAVVTLLSRVRAGALSPHATP